MDFKVVILMVLWLLTG